MKGNSQRYTPGATEPMKFAVLPDTLEDCVPSTSRDDILSLTMLQVVLEPAYILAAITPGKLATDARDVTAKRKQERKYGYKKLVQDI